MYKHFLQSPSWRAFQESEGKTVFEHSEADFSYLAILETTKLGNYLYLPYGPALSERSPKLALKHALASLSVLAKKENCFFVRIEPTVFFKESYLASLGLKKSKELNPAHTWVLDLNASEEEILKGMSQGTRTRHNQFKKKGLSTEVTTDKEQISHLTRLQHKLAKEKGINTFSDAYLKNELSQPFSSLYLVHYSPTTPEESQKTQETSPEESKKTQETSPEASQKTQKTSQETSESSEDKVISASLFFDDEKKQDQILHAIRDRLRL